MQVSAVITGSHILCVYNAFVQCESPPPTWCPCVARHPCECPDVWEDLSWLGNLLTLPHVKNFYEKIDSTILQIWDSALLKGFFSVYSFCCGKDTLNQKPLPHNIHYSCHMVAQSVGKYPFHDRVIQCTGVGPLGRQICFVTFDLWLSMYKTPQLRKCLFSLHSTQSGQASSKPFLLCPESCPLVRHCISLTGLP